METFGSTVVIGKAVEPINMVRNILNKLHYTKRDGSFLPFALF